MGYKSICGATCKVIEEKIITIKAISNKSDEILSALNEFKLKHNINDMLPYYDYIIDLLMDEVIIDRELVFKYCEVFIKTVQSSDINDYISIFMGISEDIIQYGDAPNYIDDLNLVYGVEEKLKYMGLGNLYFDKLNQSIPYSNHMYFKLIHVSALDRCKAILLTLKEINYEK